MEQKNLLGLMATMAMLSGTSFQEQSTTCVPEPDSRKPHIPVGVKTYWFDIEGNFYTTEIANSIFNCQARDEKNARRKFNNWWKNV